MTRMTVTGLVLIISVSVGSAFADEERDRARTAEHEMVASMPKSSLADILEGVSKKTGRSFLVNAHVHPEIVVGQISPKDITYRVLLTILTNNGLATFKAGDLVNIVPTHMIRQYPLPVLYGDDDSIADDEWVTRVVELEHAPAGQLVPIMRPLLPQAGHLAANPASNTIIIVDRYGNVRRVTEMIMKLDSLTPPESE